MQLPIQYFENNRYSHSSRPNAKTPSELINHNTNNSFNQQQLSQLFSNNSTPRWVRIVIINELKTLFLRSRLQDFLALFFANNHPDKLNSLGIGSCWRNMLWDKINERYNKCWKRKEKNDLRNDIRSIFFLFKRSTHWRNL